MKKILVLLVTFTITGYLSTTNAQKVYPISSGELLFQFSNTEIQGSEVTDNLRFTCFFHLGQYWHLNITDNIGFYSGLAIRNVGFIYDEPIPQKTIRRSYTLGVPLALKLGAFNKHTYILGGGEYELLFHYKGKRWNSSDRSGTKIKDSEWFSDKTNRFVPSAFAGIQFPGGLNVKFKYYLDDFLNLNYFGYDLGQPNVSFSDYTTHEMFYISVSWQFRTDKVKDSFQFTNEKYVYR